MIKGWQLQIKLQVILMDINVNKRWSNNEIIKNTQRLVGAPKLNNTQGIGGST